MKHIFTSRKEIVTAFRGSIICSGKGSAGTVWIRIICVKRLYKRTLYPADLSLRKGKSLSLLKWLL